MADSFEEIDYRLRPAKAVERRMMAESFLRLRQFGSVESYRYIGMGSVYFSDFSIFHEVCGFENMISIEDQQDATKQSRFRFNLPFGNIKLIFEHSNSALPGLSWQERSVVWLDYDGSLTTEVLTDVNYLANNLTSGSILALSVNASLNDDQRAGRSRFEVLIDRIGGRNKLPTPIDAQGNLPVDLYPMYREILSQELRDGLNNKNAGRSPGQMVEAEQIMFFRYKDGAPMLTLAWVFFDRGQQSQFLGCDFKSLNFYRNGEEAFKIAPPLLTSAEMRAVSRCDDLGLVESRDKLPFPSGQIAKFEALKRYWPYMRFAELA